MTGNTRAVLYIQQSSASLASVPCNYADAFYYDLEYHPQPTASPLRRILKLELLLHDEAT